MIAGGFFRSGQVEAWGRGIEKMIKGCLADGLPEPEFDIQPSMFSITFRIRNNDAEAIATSENGGLNFGVNGGLNFGVNFGVNETQRKIIELMVASPEVTAGQIAVKIGITKRQIEANISKLKALGIIERYGADKNGWWVVKHGNGGEKVT